MQGLLLIGQSQIDHPEFSVLRAARAEAMSWSQTHSIMDEPTEPGYSHTYQRA